VREGGMQIGPALEWLLTAMEAAKG
jgi:hypothetical protein